MEDNSGELILLLREEIDKLRKELRENGISNKTTTLSSKFLLSGLLSMKVKNELGLEKV